MRGEVDLHIHSTASDGEYAPTQLVRMALERGLSIISITDHDTTTGIDEALRAAKGTGLEVIPGVEISVDIPHREVHLLGYYIDHHNPALQEQLSLLRRSREERAKRILEKMAALGLPLRWERVIELAGEGSIGRPHIAQAMVEQGYASTIKEAFTEYIRREGPAYVERQRMSPLEAIRLIEKAKGVAVLAHPIEVVDLLPSLVEGGLVGLEVYYGGYSAEKMDKLASLASKYNLIPTGGSDFHGPSVTEGVDIGTVHVPWESVERLKKSAEARWNS